MPERSTHIGIDGFFSQRDELLSAFDAANKQATDDAVKTEPGVEGEAEVRCWLRSFLPRRFDAIKGYIITPNLDFQGGLEEWDVLVYDAIESPVLFTRARKGEQKRAIPVEFVRAILEVKARLNVKSARKCATKLLKLQNYIGRNCREDYRRYLPDTFVCAAIFLETGVPSLSSYRRSLDCLATLYQAAPVLPCLGALVVRSQPNPKHAGFLRPFRSDTPISIPDNLQLSSPFQYPHGAHGHFGTVMWGVNEYSAFLFALLDCLKGTYSPHIASFYGLDVFNTQCSRLFPENMGKRSNRRGR